LRTITTLRVITDIPAALRGGRKMGKATELGTSASRGRSSRLAPVLLLLLAGLVVCAGCTRRFFRENADREVSSVLAEKDTDGWKIEQYHVYADPRARFADISDPDHPPMPPDDPGAQELSPNPQHPDKEGIGVALGGGYLALLEEWDAANRAKLAGAKGQLDGAKETAPPAAESLPTPTPETVGPPDCAAFAGRASSHPYLINLEQCVELGVINSREFQDRREDLYLTALPVTLERFSFAAQFLAVEQVIREWSGEKSTIGLHNRWIANSNVGGSLLFPTGGLLLLDFANQTVVDFTKFPKTVSESTATLNLIQPLLRGGGKAVTLEPLTQSERNLLYQVRNYARFRKEFYVSIAGGGGGSISGGSFVPTGVIITSNFNAGQGLGGSGLSPGNIPPVPTTGVSPQVTPGQSGQLNLTKAIPPPAAGYLGTLLQYAQIGIDQDNIEVLEYFLKLFQAIKEGGDISQLQVDTVEQQLLGGRTQKLLDEQQYGNAIEQFRLQLGLPPELPTELDNTAIRPLIQQFARYRQVFDQVTQVTDATTRLGDADAAPRLRAELHRLVETAGLTASTRFRLEFPKRWAEWEKLNADEIKARRKKLSEERQKLLDRQANAERRQALLDLQAKLAKDGKQLTEADRKLLDQLEKEGQPLTAAEQDRLAEIEADDNYGSLEATLRDYEAQPWKNEPDAKRRGQKQTSAFRDVINAFDLVLGQVRNERLDALRPSWPELPALDVDGVDLLKSGEDEAYTAASKAALENRLDMMNARAQTVDAWRQLRVFANALLGTVNVQYNMTTTTPAGKNRPFALGGSRYDHQLVINTEAPLVRVAERNNYRASLIAYQRQRRALMEAEDLAKQTVRGEVRQLRQLAADYKIQQRLVELAYLTVENSLDTFQQPPAAAGPSQANAGSAAALTSQLLGAQRSLPAAQNQILTFWINYLNTRLQLYRDLELMPLDERGVWIDDIATRQSPGSRACDEWRANSAKPAENDLQTKPR
jgi:outer membrane protein TolC